MSFIHSSSQSLPPFPRSLHFSLHYSMLFVHPGFSNPSRLQFHLHRSHHMSILCCMQLNSPTRLLGQDLLPQLDPEVIPACHRTRYIQHIVSISSPSSHLLRLRLVQLFIQSLADSPALARCETSTRGTDCRRLMDQRAGKGRGESQIAGWEE